MTERHVFPGPCECEKCAPTMPGYRGFKAGVNKERAEATVRTSQPAEPPAEEGPYRLGVDLDSEGNVVGTGEELDARPSAEGKGCEHEWVHNASGGMRSANPKCQDCRVPMVVLPADVVARASNIIDALVNNDLDSLGPDEASEVSCLLLALLPTQEGGEETNQC